jgi:hypothetical protein
MERVSVIASAIALAALAALALGGAVTANIPPLTIETSSARDQRHEQRLPQQLAKVDEALGRKDFSKAIFEWRDAYGLALGSRRWEAMVEVGDAAVRIDKLTGLPSGYPTAFRAEARQAYLRALFQARSARSQDGIQRVAQAFEALGDREMAMRARAIVVAR